MLPAAAPGPSRPGLDRSLGRRRAREEKVTKGHGNKRLKLNNRWGLILQPDDGERVRVNGPEADLAPEEPLKVTSPSRPSSRQSDYSQSTQPAAGPSRPGLRRPRRGERKGLEVDEDQLKVRSRLDPGDEIWSDTDTQPSDIEGSGNGSDIPGSSQPTQEEESVPALRRSNESNLPATTDVQNRQDAQPTDSGSPRLRAPPRQTPIAMPVEEEEEL
jgi:hypothetical protein